MNYIKNIKQVTLTVIIASVFCCSCNRRAYNAIQTPIDDTVYVELNVMEVIDTGYVYSVLRNVDDDFAKQNLCDRVKIRQYVLKYSDSIISVTANNYYIDITDSYSSSSMSFIPYGVFMHKGIPVLCIVDTLHQQHFCKIIEKKQRTIGLLDDVDVWVGWECFVNSKGNVLWSDNIWKTLSRDPDYEREMKEFCKYGYVKKRRR